MIMKTWMKSLLCISLSFMCLFTCVGYAAINGTLSIVGTAETVAMEPTGIYIYAVEVIEPGNISNDSVEIVYPTSLRSTLRANAENTSITYKITVHNKTDMTHWFLGIKHDGLGDNSLVNITNGVVITTRDGAASGSNAFDTADWIPPQTQRTFYATYVFGSNAQGNRSTLVNFSFGLHVSSVSDGFLKVLNDKDPSSPYGYYYLTNAFNENYSQNNSTVINNIGSDKEVFDNLFGSSITVNIDGQKLPATIMVERKDVDGKNTGDSYPGSNTPSGCEYTVYLTVDDLSGSGQATVYAVSYTCGEDGVWYQIGELYEGTSTVTGNLFDVTSWLAKKKTYTVIDGVSYKVAAGNSGQPYEQCTTIRELMSVKLEGLFNDVNNNSSKLLKPACVTVYSYRNNNGKWVESINEANRYKEGYNELKIAFDMIKPYCFINNGGFERLDINSQQMTRAELIYLLENLQHAYDYYMTLNPNG